MKKVVLFLVVVLLMILSSNQNVVKAELPAPACPMGYAVFEHNIFGGGRFTVLRCDCAYEDCKGWGEQCQAGGVLV